MGSGKGKTRRSKSAATDQNQGDSSPYDNPPFSIQEARYWHVNGNTKFSCVIKNLSLEEDCELTSVALIHGLRASTGRPTFSADILPWGPDIGDISRNGKVVSAGGELEVNGELCNARGTPGTYKLHDSVRIKAYSGTRKSDGVILDGPA